MLGCFNNRHILASLSSFWWSEKYKIWIRHLLITYYCKTLLAQCSCKRTTRRANVQMIHICHTYMTSLQVLWSNMFWSYLPFITLGQTTPSPVVGWPSPTKQVPRWQIWETPSDMKLRAANYARPACSNKQSWTKWLWPYQDRAGRTGGTVNPSRNPP